jgi:hypothetical protein
MPSRELAVEGVDDGLKVLGPQLVNGQRHTKVGDRKVKDRAKQLISN